MLQIPPWGRDVICSVSEWFFQVYSYNPVICYTLNPVLGPFQVSSVDPAFPGQLLSTSAPSTDPSETKSHTGGT